MVKFYTRKEASEELGVHYHTIIKMGKEGEIKTVKIGDHIHYDVDNYLKEKGYSKPKIRRRICYCRVSSRKQSANLENQKKVMRSKYPYYEIISDYGSGLNNKRPGYRKILDKIIKGEVEELVIAYKDRLSRFNYDLVNWMIKEYSDGKITVLNKTEEKTPHEEISEDILAIMNVYVAKINGLRKYKKMLKNEITNT